MEKEHGLSEAWYENGQQESKENYVDGKEHGLREWWYPKNEGGQLWVKVNFVDGKRNGLYEMWYENGQPSLKKNYVDGKLHELQREWDEDGKLVSKIYCIDGISFSNEETEKMYQKLLIQKSKMVINKVLELRLLFNSKMIFFIKVY